jgi:hypothetical protein
MAEYLLEQECHLLWTVMGSRLLTTRVLIRAVIAVLFAIAEQTALDAVAVAAREEPVLAQWLVRDEQRLHLALLVLQLAVLDGILPVARLLLDVKVQTGWTADGLQTLRGERLRTRDNRSRMVHTHRRRALDDIAARVALVGD